MKNWEVGYDGPSRPIICCDDFKMLSLSKFENGKWVSYADEDADARFIVTAVNFYLKAFEKYWGSEAAS